MTIFLTWIFLCQINKGRALNLLLLLIEVENKTLQSIFRSTFHTVSLFWWCWCLAWSYFLQDAALFLQICITKMIIPNIHVETLGGFKPSETYYVCQICMISPRIGVTNLQNLWKHHPGHDCSHKSIGTETSIFQANICTKIVLQNSCLQPFSPLTWFC